MQVTGLVTRLNQRTKKADGTMMRAPSYSILLDDSTWYNFGFDAPTCGEGDVITFEATQSQYGMDAKFSSVQKAAPGLAASAPVAKAVQSADARQESIVYQSSLKVATDIVGLALVHEALTLPTKKAERLPVIVASVREVARDLALEAIKPDFSTFGAPEVGAPDDE